MVRAYQRANNSKRRIDEQYFQVIEDLQTLGLGKGEIRKILKKNKIGGADGIMRGRFEPFKLSDDARRKMRNAGNSEIYKQTRGPLRDIYKELRGTKLTRDEEPAPQPAPSANRFGGNPVQLPAPPQSTPIPRPSANRFGGNPVQQVDPRLLPDPRTRELLNR